MAVPNPFGPGWPRLVQGVETANLLKTNAGPDGPRDPGPFVAGGREGDKRHDAAGRGTAGKCTRTYGYDNHPDRPDRLDQQANSRTYPVHFSASHPVRPDHCRHCGHPIDWRHDGLPFADGSASHIACHGRAAGTFAKRFRQKS
jgi:hypothetical protein